MTNTESTRQSRWQPHTCTRCGTELTVGMVTYALRWSRYEPMLDGPAWEAVGDWTEPQESAGTVCADCREAVIDFAMTFSYARLAGESRD